MAASVKQVCYISHLVKGSCKPYHGKPYPTLAIIWVGLPSFINPPIWVISIITENRTRKLRNSETPLIPLKSIFSIDNGNHMHMRLQCYYKIQANIYAFRAAPTKLCTQIFHIGQSKMSPQSSRKFTRQFLVENGRTNPMVSRTSVRISTTSSYPSGYIPWQIDERRERSRKTAKSTSKQYHLDHNIVDMYWQHIITLHRYRRYLRLQLTRTDVVSFGEQRLYTSTTMTQRRRLDVHLTLSRATKIPTCGKRTDVLTMR